MPWRTRNIEALPYFCSAIGAEALYTMTMLRPTSRIVAMNSARSDFSFLAISLYSSTAILPKQQLPARLRYARSVSGQQSSVGPGPRHQLPWPGQPGFPAADPPPREPTDDCSPLTTLNRVIG